MTNNGYPDNTEWADLILNRKAWYETCQAVMPVSQETLRCQKCGKLSWEALARDNQRRKAT